MNTRDILLGLFFTGLIFGLISPVAAAPTATLISPANGLWATYTNNTAPFVFNVSLTISCNVTKANCSLYVDGVLAAGGNTSAPNNTASNTVYANWTLTEGAHTWNVSCSACGEYAAVAPRTLKLDRSAPTSITITQPTAEQEINSAAVGVNFTAIDLYNASMTCTMSSDSHQVNSSSLAVTNNTATSIGWSSMTEGTHGVQVTCTDGLGYALTSSIRVFKVSIPTTGNKVKGICSGGAEWNVAEKRCCNLGEYYDLGSYRCRVRATGQVQQPQAPAAQNPAYVAPAASATALNIGGIQTSQEAVVLVVVFGVFLYIGYVQFVK